jgi:hypothetical protein
MGLRLGFRLAPHVYTACRSAMVVALPGIPGTVMEIGSTRSWACS